ncbi:hypothetical protein FIBSPDRAFT_608151 [Athelia psychrophila]|uniref:Uncharacterized protein n=1 Tax=Athelia psychrophila TaxID=1759441 RepID=A0A166GHV6_9AGAM|nr:hypothetical protein FIBSPDRAFT_608151 [Fibularhizoctonia sp. CBS 109695]
MPKLPTGRMIKRHYYLRKASTLTLPSFDMPTSPAETLGAALSDNLSLTVTGGLRRRSNDSGDRAWEIGIIVVFLAVISAVLCALWLVNRRRRRERESRRALASNQLDIEQHPTRSGGAGSTDAMRTVARPIGPYYMGPRVVGANCYIMLV